MDMPSTAMQTIDLQSDRRHDDDTRLLIDQAIQFKQTLGRAVAVSFLVEHHVPPPVLQRVMMQAVVPVAELPS